MWVFAVVAAATLTVGCASDDTVPPGTSTPTPPATVAANTTPASSATTSPHPTSPSSVAASPTPTGRHDCDPAYPDVCITPAGGTQPGLRLVVCGVLEATSFVVLPPDPYVLDPDGDGIACEPGQVVPMHPRCDPSLHADWPGPVALLLARLPMPDDVCLRPVDSLPLPGRTDTDTIGSYSPDRREVIALVGDDGQPPVPLLIHELCHAHQHQVLLDTFGPSSTDLDRHLDTPEGRAYLDAEPEPGEPGPRGPDEVAASERPQWLCEGWYQTLHGEHDLPSPCCPEVGKPVDVAASLTEAQLAWGHRYLPLWP